MELIFEWDANKAQSNLRKHGIDFDEAKTIFSDPQLLTFPDDFHSHMEERFISIGYSSRDRIVLVVHTDQRITENKIIIRIISCRRATNAERKFYEE